MTNEKGFFEAIKQQFAAGYSTDCILGLLECSDHDKRSRLGKSSVKVWIDDDELSSFILQRNKAKVAANTSGCFLHCSVVKFVAHCSVMYHTIKNDEHIEEYLELENVKFRKCK